MPYSFQKSELAEMVKSPLYDFNVGPIAPPPVYQFTFLTASFVPQGFRPMSFDINYRNGNRYMTVNTLLVIDIGSGPVTVTGQMTFDKFNGSIVSRTIDAPPGGTMVTMTGSNGPITDPPTSIPDDTTEVWSDMSGVYQSIGLAEPVSIDDGIVIVDSLLDAANLSSLAQGELWLTGYELAPPFGVPAFQIPIATWVPDPDVPNTGSGQPAIPAWVTLDHPTTFILDRDLPAHVDPVVYLTDQGPFSPGIPGPNFGPGASVSFFQGDVLSVAASRLLVRLLDPSSSHCAAIIYDANGHAAGNSDSAIVVTADPAGKLTLFRPDLVIDSTSDGEQGTSWLYINNHPSGITCVPN